MTKFLDYIKNLFSTWKEIDTTNTLVYVKMFYIDGKKYPVSYYYGLPSLKRLRAIGIMVFQHDERENAFTAHWKELNVPLDPKDIEVVIKDFITTGGLENESYSLFPVHDKSINTLQFIVECTEKHIESIFYKPAINDEIKSLETKKTKRRVSPKKSPIKKDTAKKAVSQAKKSKKPRK